MNLACTIIPTHPPHFNYTLNALESYNKNVNGNLYLVFSNNSDYELFNSKTNEKFNHLILESPFTTYENIINAKKFYAVDKLSKKYKYIGVFDTESEFIKPYDEYIEYKNIFETKKFKSNNSENGKLITKDVLDVMQFNETQRNIILKETNDLNQYWWFNEACVYESETFCQFFNWLQLKDNFTDIMAGRHYFDYFLYSMWLIVFKGFKIKTICNDIIFKWSAIEQSMNIDVVNKFESLISKLPNCEYTKVIIHKDR
jgi:hypothetical protein